MKNFLDQDFLLDSSTAQELYHDYAVNQPIIDYHCHLSPEAIASDHHFRNLTEAWLDGDHYKWRAMRTHGVSEYYCTGEAPDDEKFKKWADTVPYTIRNPLYHWTHLELQRYFGISALLKPDSAESIYKEVNEKLNEMGVRRMLDHMNVEVVCTTDDPVDDLQYHRKLASRNDDLILLPAFRADKLLDVQHPDIWNRYVDQLGESANINIDSYNDLLEALKSRHDYFHKQGCRLSDNGLIHMYAEDFTEQAVVDCFTQLRNNHRVDGHRENVFRSAILYEIALLNHEKGWTQQYHLGAIRNNNYRKLRELGPDTGFDSIGDYSQAVSLSRFLSKLDAKDQLTKTIIYNLNPSDNAVMATMIGNFNDGSTAGKIQWGSGWWFLDQKDGIEQQLNTLSNMGLLSHFVGMLTDSRSFLSFPRHEYFRRILCNLLGNDVENGLIPNEVEWLGKMVKDICYNNAREYFGFYEIGDS